MEDKLLSLDLYKNHGARIKKVYAGVKRRSVMLLLSSFYIKAIEPDNALWLHAVTQR